MTGQRETDVIVGKSFALPSLTPVQSKSKVPACQVPLDLIDPKPRIRADPMSFPHAPWSASGTSLLLPCPREQSGATYPLENARDPTKRCLNPKRPLKRALGFKTPQRSLQSQENPRERVWDAESSPRPTLTGAGIPQLYTSSLRTSIRSSQVASVAPSA